MKKKKSNPNNKITYQINTKKRNIIIITVLTLIILLAGITTGIILYNKNNDEGSTNMVEVTTTEQEAKVTTEVATTEKKEETTTEAKKPSKKEEATTERPISGGVNAPTTEATKENKSTTEAPKHNTEKTTEAPKNEKPVAEAPKNNTPTHSHSWQKATCTSPKTCTICGATEGSALGHDFSVDKPETIEHPGEPIYESHTVCSGCNAILDGLGNDGIEAHMKSQEHGACGYGSSNILVGYTDSTTETVHHYYCSRCGAAK